MEQTVRVSAPSRVITGDAEKGKSGAFLEGYRVDAERGGSL
jgi:hypothetical protein